MFRLMWGMIYFRELPLPLSEYDNDALGFFFEFANTYTEESILKGYQAQKKRESDNASVEQMRALGYSDEDILNMNLK